MRTALTALFMAGIAVIAAIAQPEVALAHTGDDAEFKHVVIEFALWGIGLGAAIALLIAVFWVRARVLRRAE